MITIIWHSGPDKTKETVKRSVAAKGLGGEGGGGMSRRNTGNIRAEKLCVLAYFDTVMADT